MSRCEGQRNTKNCYKGNDRVELTHDNLLVSCSDFRWYSEYSTQHQFIPGCHVVKGRGNGRNAYIFGA